MKVWQVVGRAALRQEMDEAEIAEIIQRGERQSDDRWFLGDVANKWAKNIREFAIPCSIMDMYDEIAYLYRDNVGGHSIRKYGEIAAFYPQWARDEYAVLPWFTFEVAMRYSREKWQDVMEMCLNYMEGHNGRPPSKRWLEAELSGRLDKMIAQQFEDARPDYTEAELLTAPDMMMYDEMVADSTGSDFGPVTVQAAVRFVDVLAGSLDRFPVGDELRGRLRTALSGLNEILRDVLKELS